jgi:hypothetical protein
MAYPRIVPAWLLLACALPLATASALTPPIAEPFDTGVNYWRDAALADLTFQPTGGADGGFAQAQFNLVNSQGGAVGSREASTMVIRGRSLAVPGVGELTASDGLFFGDWLANDVGAFSVMVRHSAPEPLSFFARFAGPNNFPGVAANIAEPVEPNEWTELIVPMDLTSSQWALEGSSPAPALSNVGRIQLGFYAPTSLAGIDQNYSLDIDNVRLLAVPEPLSLITLGFAGMGWLLVRRARVAR